MKKLATIILMAALLAGLSQAVTDEAQKPNYWQEFDIAFWQTAPFAAFWVYAIGTQLAKGGQIDWNTAMAVAAAISAGNAAAQARLSQAK